MQGAVNPDEFYVYKPALRPAATPILRRNVGAKAIKMVYAERGAVERVVRSKCLPSSASASR